MKPVGILRFLGTNCDRDVWQAIEAVGLKPQWLWYEDRFRAEDYAAFVVPGGFSYGDYLRCGALAAKAPVMKSLAEAAEKGYPVLGICNGFQILCESGLLPGALVRNEGRRFVDTWVSLRLESEAPTWTRGMSPAVEIRLPVAHGEGRFYVEPEELDRLRARGQVWWTYSGENPNGSVADIAGVCNEGQNVWGLMPHPERAIFDWMGREDGRAIFSALADGTRGE
ncbi:MAG: phosphoribosylformylglycinamidine synthase subunit PurQ [Bdellovibrionales bacterium]